MSDVAPLDERPWWAARELRDDLPAISAKRAYGEILFVYGCFFLAPITIAIASLLSHVGSSSYTWSESLAASINQVAVTALAVTVPVLLCARRGVNLRDLGLSRDIVRQPAQGIRLGAWCFLGFVAGGLVATVLSSRRFPFPHFSAPNLMVELFHAVQAGPLEEIVVLAFVVTTLQQARRPLIEIVVVALVLRDAFHLYYGLGALGVVVWASLFLWLFLRLRALWPMIIAHSLWDVNGTLGAYWRPVALAGLLAMVLLMLVATITWIVHSGQSKTYAYM